MLVGAFIAQVIEPSDAEQAKREAEQKKESAVRDPIAAFTGLLVLATACSVVVLVLQWLTFEKTDRTLNATLVATQRPWIKIVSVKAISPLAFKNDGTEVGGGVTLLFNLENVGKSPAIKPIINSRLAFTFDLPATQRAYCEAIKKDRIGTTHGLQPENTIFPTDNAGAESLAWTQRDEMKLAVQRAANMPDNKVDFLSIIGCVFYDFSLLRGGSASDRYYVESDQKNSLSERH